jgi:hypothetical protein
MPFCPGWNAGMVVWRVRCVAPCSHHSVRDGTLAWWSQSGELDQGQAIPSGTEYWDGGLESEMCRTMPTPFRPGRNTGTVVAEW